VRAGLGSWCGATRLATELVAERRHDLGREVVLVARGEPGEQRGRDHGRRHVLVDRLGDRPAPLARVLYVRRNVVELRAVLLEGRVKQLKQPTTNDRAVPPDAGDLVQV